MLITVIEDNYAQSEQLIKLIDNYLAINKLDNWFLINKTSKFELEKSIPTRKSGLYLLSIGAKYRNIIETAKKIRKYDKSCYIVFISDCEDYIYDIVQGMIRPSGYILNKKLESELPMLLSQIVSELNSKFICLSDQGEKRFVNIDDIIYAVYNNDSRKIDVYLQDKSIISIIGSLNKLSEKLGGKFLKVERHVLVNTSKIVRLDVYSRKILLLNGDMIDISRNSCKTIREILLNSTSLLKL